MQLPSLKHAQPNQGKKTLTCYITDTSVTLAVWHIEEDEIKVLVVGTPKEWQEDSQLADAIEFGITELKDQAKDVKDVLLGLPDEWVEGDDILPDRKKILKQISQQQHITPVGFVLSHEALWKYLSKKSGAANSALFFEMSTGEIVLSLIENGQSTQRETVGRSETLIDDLQEAIARFQRDVFPPQVFFFSTTLADQQLEDIKNEFLNFDWVKEGQFSRIPEVEVLKKIDIVNAISEVGGQEILKAQAKPDPAENEETNVIPVKPESISHPESTKVSSFGVPVATTQKVVEKHSEPEELEEIDEEPQPSKKKFSLPFFKKGLPRMGGKSRFSQKPFMIGAVVIGIALVVGYFFLKTQVSAIVNIKLKTETVQKDVQIALDPDASSEESNSVLKASIVKKKVSGSQEASTTGSKLIGEKASGVVTIFNGTENTKSFTKGTELQANNKKFVLDEDVTVASATAKIDSNLNKTLESGKKEAKIIAADIGAEFNLSKDTEFTIANFSKDTYVGRNEKEVAGGTSRESQAVSKDDQQKLLKSLKDELTKEVEKQLNESKQDGEYIVLSGKNTLSDQKFSAEVGEETQNLKVEASLESEAYVYQAQDLRPLAQNTLVSMIPEGSALLEDTISILSRESQTSSSSAQVILDAELSAKYTPPTQSEEWVNEIKGRTLEQAEGLLKGKSQIQEVTITLRPAFAKFLFGSLPSKPDRIQLIKEVQ